MDKSTLFYVQMTENLKIIWETIPGFGKNSRSIKLKSSVKRQVIIGKITIFLEDTPYYDKEKHSSDKM